jgi:mono/diheme cytochrome c family protein
MKSSLTIMAVVASILAGCDMPNTQALGVFATNCAACHGAGGKGDGPMAKDLPIPPADLTRLALADDGSFPSERVMATIYGYPGKFHSSAMPEFGPLLEGEQVMWTDSKGQQVPTPKVLVELVQYLESIQEG